MYRLYFIFTVLFILTSCSKYQKLLKSTDFDLKLEKAKEYYLEEDFTRALPLLEELSSVMRGTEKAEEVSYYYAYCHYGMEENLMSAYLFNKYVRTFPKGKHAEEASYMEAFCYYLEAPRYSLESRNTKKAINKLQEFINNFPLSTRIGDCNKLIDELNIKLERKAFEISKQYHNTEQYRAAIISLNSFLIDFPSTLYREEVQFLILESSYLLAINSIPDKKKSRLEETVDFFEMFKDNYPESKYLKDMNTIYTKTITSLEELK